jgi:hypothetical protein
VAEGLIRAYRSPLANDKSPEGELPWQRTLEARFDEVAA